MSDFIKWGLIAAAIIIAIGLLVGSEFLGVGFPIALTNLYNLVLQFVRLMGNYLVNARALANCFVLDGFEILLTCSIGWLVIKPFVLWAITKGVKILKSFMT